MVDKRKRDRYGNIITPLNELKPLVLTHTQSDRITHYQEACKRVWVFHAKWLEIKRTGDTARAKNFEDRVRDCIESARIAKRDLILNGLDPKQYV